MIHGGAIATIIDSVVVPAIGVAYDTNTMAYCTIDLAVQDLRPLTGDAVSAAVTRIGQNGPIQAPAVGSVCDNGMLDSCQF